MRWCRVALSLLFLLTTAKAAAPDTPLATFRAETAEVHIALSAFDKHDRPLTELTLSDFKLSRDGHPLDVPLQLQRRQDSPISAVVMTDVSYSMEKAASIARESWQWMNANLLRESDRVHYVDFGVRLNPSDVPAESHMRLTSLYDCLLTLIPQIPANEHGRRTLILFTDGIDNNSVHGLQDVLRLAISRDISVYAITVWKHNVNYDWQVLDSLTSATGGRYFVVRDTKEMTGALQSIANELRDGYEVVFRADKSSPGLHRITIESTARKMRINHRAAYYQPATPRNGVLVASGR
jgi:hypothetical protein